jgi:hypothetical protein
MSQTCRHCAATGDGKEMEHPDKEEAQMSETRKARIPETVRSWAFAFSGSHFQD